MKKITPLIIFLLLLLGMAAFPYIPIYLFNIKLDNLSQNMKVLFNFACDIAFMFIIFLIYRKEIIKNFKEYIKHIGVNFETSFKYYFIGLIIMIISNVIISLCFSEANANNEDTIRSLINLYPVYMIFSVSIYAPFIEEMIFRKSIKDIFTTISNHKIVKYLYIIFSGLIFASLHVVGMATGYLDYLFIIPYLSLGCSFAALYYKTDNIFSTITMHSLHNTVAVILYFAMGVV